MSAIPLHGHLRLKGHDGEGPYLYRYTTEEAAPSVCSACYLGQCVQRVERHGGTGVELIIHDVASELN